MTSPRRLLDEGTPFERDVLASARRDAGGGEGLKRTLAVMSLGAAAATAASSIASAGLAAGTSAGAGASVAPASAGTGALLKWIALALVVGTAATTPAIRWASRRPHVVAASVTSPPAMTASLPQPAIVAPPSMSLQPATDEALPAVPAPRPPAAIRARIQPVQPDPRDPVTGGPAVDIQPGASGSAAHPRAASTLYAELAALAGVRAALDRGDSHGALQSLDVYDSAFPGSVLAEEAAVLRIDALAQGGNGVAAAALGRRFLASNPSSAHAPHVRRLIDDAHNP